MQAAVRYFAFKEQPRLSAHSDEARRRAEALFKKEQQAREGQQAMAEYHAKLDAIRENTARLRALRLAATPQNAAAMVDNKNR